MRVSRMTHEHFIMEINDMTEQRDAARARAEVADRQVTELRQALLFWDRLRVFAPLDSGTDIADVLKECATNTDRVLAAVHASEPAATEVTREMCRCDPSLEFPNPCPRCASGEWQGIHNADCETPRCVDGTGYLEPATEVKP